MKLMATLPLLDTHAREIAEHPLVDELRFNTIVPRPPKWSHKRALEHLLEMCNGKPLLIDLKGRQLRVTSYADPWFNHVTLSHEIELDCPATLKFRTGKATIHAVHGNHLVLSDIPEDILGAGQAVNILDPSLKIHGFLTDDDLAYREAAKELGIRNVALSFTEELDDILEYRRFDPNANIWAKIESERGMEFVKEHFASIASPNTHIMIARGDLFDNAGDDRTRYLEWERTLLEYDPEAIIASRILQSSERDEEPSLEDLRELEHHFASRAACLMLADGVCRKGRAFHAAMRAYEKFVRYWERAGYRLTHAERTGSPPPAPRAPAEQARRGENGKKGEGHEGAGSIWSWLGRRG